MNPNQVTDLETSQKLKALGCEQRSTFYWCSYIQRPGLSSEEVSPYLIWGMEGWVKQVLVSAYTLSELVEMCGDEITLEISRGDQSTAKQWDYLDKHETPFLFIGPTPIAAVSALLIGLLDKNK